MYFPIHIYGFTFFPRAEYLEGCWRPLVHVVAGSGQITQHRCNGGYPAEAIAVTYARIEMRPLAAVLRDACRYVAEDSDAKADVHLAGSAMPVLRGGLADQP